MKLQLEIPHHQGASEQIATFIRTSVSSAIWPLLERARQTVECSTGCEGPAIP